MYRSNIHSFCLQHVLTASYNQTRETGLAANSKRLLCWRYILGGEVGRTEVSSCFLSDANLALPKHVYMWGWDFAPSFILHKRVLRSLGQALHLGIMGNSEQLFPLPLQLSSSENNQQLGKDFFQQWIDTVIFNLVSQQKVCMVSDLKKQKK